MKIIPMGTAYVIWT
ncbi:hypothetical protein [Bacillus wiedmannii]